MATHEEKRWPPAGRFNGRLWGAFHGHRQSEGGYDPISSTIIPRGFWPNILRMALDYPPAVTGPREGSYVKFLLGGRVARGH